jgi:transcriptional regulator GlxA family with amidase domain
MDQRVHRVVTLMNADPRQALNVRKLAKSVNLSTAHLFFLFKTETGTSPARYFKLTRMEYSAALLTSTFLSVKEIMWSAGFRDGSHFVRDFKAIYGQTPSEYRQNNTDSNCVTGDGWAQLRIRESATKS